ncbi:MAG: 1-acyl-sn-glycerol-3-phosphate acyltransferase [Myxococcota bacterium]|nr:1-acyl-sn-glycerol-3-phosphate acyltransferase [Myxococcota bacterium]
MDSPSPQLISQALQRRLINRLKTQSDDAVFRYLADSIYLEQRRFDRSDIPPPDAYKRILKRANRAIRKERSVMIESLVKLVDYYAREIHNPFSERTYAITSKVLPGMLTRLLTAAQPSQLLGNDFDPASRIVVQGPTEHLKQLSANHTLVYTPTHLSNLDSPIIGYALVAAGLKPVVYGAGLNLFSNPLMEFFMRRLGAYTVDRRKQNQLYKDSLKDYSTHAIKTGFHSLFYPGGTRSRNGAIEQKLKKGLLGTAMSAWQESLQEGRPREVVIVPCTLSFSLTLEAETLIDDALAEAGKSRYIITDDELSETRTVAHFARRVLNLDASVYVRFGHPLDVVGNPVNKEGHSLDPNGAVVDRREYICNRDGEVTPDTQRDQQYTIRLSNAITQAYQSDCIALNTHVAALAAWRILQHRYPLLDDIQRASLRKEDRRIKRAELVQSIDRIQQHLRQKEQLGQVHLAISNTATAILEDSVIRFASFHRQKAISIQGSNVDVSPKLILYYANRLRHISFPEALK